MAYRREHEKEKFRLKSGQILQEQWGHPLKGPVENGVL